MAIYINDKPVRTKQINGKTHCSVIDLIMALPKGQYGQTNLNDVGYRYSASAVNIVNVVTVTVTPNEKEPLLIKGFMGANVLPALTMEAQFQTRPESKWKGTYKDGFDYMAELDELRSIIRGYGFTVEVTEGSGEVYAIGATTHAMNKLSDEQRKANAKYIYDYLRIEDWTPQAICGLFGNIHRESWFNPGVWQYFLDGHGNTKYGYGIVQWTAAEKKILKWMGNPDVEFGKRTAISYRDADKMAEENPKQLMDHQLEYLLWSCYSTTHSDYREWWSTSGYGNPVKSMSFTDFTGSELDAGTLALVFHASYERSEDSDEIKEERKTYAREWYDYLKDR